jgi:hypothetical protein
MLIVSRSKRADVDWKALSYDLSGVDWNSVFSKTPAAAAKPTPTPEQKKPEPVVASPTPEAKKEAAPTPAAASSSKPAESSKAAEPSAKKESVVSNIVDTVTDLMANVASISSAIDAKVGANDKSDNGGLWISKDGEWGMDVTNNGEDAVYYCWLKNGFSGMSINVNAPAISVGIKKGQTVSISAAPGISGACAPATKSPPLVVSRTLGPSLPLATPARVSWVSSTSPRTST